MYLQILALEKHERPVKFFSRNLSWCKIWLNEVKVICQYNEGCNHAMISFVIIAKLVYVKFGPSQTDVASDHIFYRSSRRGLLSKTKSSQKILNNMHGVSGETANLSVEKHSPK